uniref:Protein inhibitor of activated STAT, 1b n=2 Tax=Hucho hucho TaxID=62062 RepID=A0A4W5RAI6_9TELE
MLIFFFSFLLPKQMVMSLRVSELQVLLSYAGRNKHGRKHQLLTKSLHLLKAGCSPAVQMKVKELYRRRFPAKMLSPVDLALPSVHSTSSLPGGLTSLGFDSHGSPSPGSLLVPKHELGLHPVHPDVKLQRLPFYDMLDELIKPTSLASDNSQRFQETCYAFALTPQQVQQISSSIFCLSETSCAQEDHFPSNLCVKVNSKPCNLPVSLSDSRLPSSRVSNQKPITNTLSWSWGPTWFVFALVLTHYPGPGVLQGLLFMEILNSCEDCDEIQFKEDGNWYPMRSKKEVTEVSASFNGDDGTWPASSSSPHRNSSSHSSANKVVVIDLTLDSSSDDELDDEPPLKRPCPPSSLSPASPPISKGVLNLHSQVSPVARAPSMPPVETSYIPPPPPLIQDYSHYYHTPNDLDLNFFSFLQGDNHQHYNMVMAAAAAASASDDHDLLLNRFLPYSSSQMFLDQPGTPGGGSSALAAANGGSNSGSSSSLMSSSSLRERDRDRERDSRSNAVAAVIYGSIPDVISLD